MKSAANVELFFDMCKYFVNFFDIFYYIFKM